MNVFQITAMIPGHGEVPLLVSPPLADANNILSGTHDDINGSASTTLGGALLIALGSNPYRHPYLHTRHT